MVPGISSYLMTPQTDGLVTRARATRLDSAPGVLALVGLTLVLSCSEPNAPPVPEKLVLITAPTSPAQNRIPFPTQPAVQVQDQNGNPMGAGIVVTAAVSSGGGDLLGTTTATTGTNGIATFTDLSITGVVGERTLTFSTPGTSSVSASVALNAGAPHQLTRLTPENQTITVFSPVPILPSVRVTDVDGNPVSGVPVIFEILTGPSAIGGLNPVTDASGTATLGSWTVHATGPAVTVLEVHTPGVFTFVHFRATVVAFNVRAVSTGRGHACAISTDYAVYCWGRNDKGQLGDGTTTNRLKPTKVPFPSSLQFDSVEAGPEHTCALTWAGKAYCWGRNSEYQLGAELDAPFVTAPVAVRGTLAFSELEATYHGTCGRSVSAMIYCWGGDPEIVSSPSSDPTEVYVGFVNVLTAGDYHTCVDKPTDLSTWCWGRNTHGQLGTSAVQSSATPVRVEGGHAFHSVKAGRHTCGFVLTGQVYCWGENQGPGFTDAFAPVQVQGGVRFLDPALVSVGDWTCGLGRDQTETIRHYCWGENSGRVVDGSENSYSVPTPITTQVPLPLTPVARLKTSANFVCGSASDPAIGANGAAFCWGGNEYGQLGTGDTTPSSQPRGVIPP